MNTEITNTKINQSLAKFEATPANLELVKQTIAKNATNEELTLFMHLATKYNLDPFAKEIWFLKYKQTDTPQIYVSRDGYLKYAQQSGKLDGLKSYTVEDDKGNPVKGVCEIYHKDMKYPVKAEIKVSEYKQNSPVWNKYPSAMAIKVAEVFALKRAFGLNGVVTEDEVPPKRPEAEYVEADLVNEHPVITAAQRSRLFAIGKASGWNQDEIKDHLIGLGFESTKDIPQGEIYDAICADLQDNKKQPAEADPFDNLSEIPNQKQL